MIEMVYFYFFFLFILYNLMLFKLCTEINYECFMLIQRFMHISFINIEYYFIFKVNVNDTYYEFCLFLLMKISC